MNRWTVFGCLLVVWHRVDCQVPAKCCMSRQFSATLSDLNTVNSEGIVVRHLQLDFDRQLEAIRSSTVHPGSGNETNRIRSIMNFATGVMHTIHNDDESQCFKSTFTFPLAPSCVPDDALYLGSTYLGPPPGLAYHSWRYPYTGTQANLTMAFSDQGCVPVVEGITGHLAPEEPINTMFLFSEYVPRLDDPREFVLPPSCH